jgi:cell division protein FtsA
MPRPHLITGLDIGTKEIKALTVRKNSDEELEVVALIKKPTTGIRRGVIIDIDGVSGILENINQELKEQTGKNIDSLYVNIDGSHIFCTSSQGTVAVSRADRKISEEDIDRVIEAAKTFSLPSNKEIIDVFPRNFIVDGEKVREALGMEGVRLELEALVVCGFSPYFKNLTQAVLNAGFSIQNVIPTPLAAALSCLTPRQKELGVALLDIGAGTTGLSVLEEGNLIHLAILPIGSANITNDIAIGLKTDIDVAERIKKEFGTCLISSKEKREKIEITEPEDLVFTQGALTKIIEARVSEIFGEVNKELKKINKEALLPAGVVLTGGGAKLPKMVELAKKDLKLPCRVGKPRGFLNLEGDPALSTVCGLVLEGVETEEGQVPIGAGIGSKIKNFLKNFIP